MQRICLPYLPSNQRTQPKCHEPQTDQLSHSISQRPIKSKFVSTNPNTIKFVDVDALYEGHRFCKPSKRTAEDAIGANDDNIWFISLQTRLDETEIVSAAINRNEEEEFRFDLFNHVGNQVVN
jgi:hypothetical protein